MYGDNVKSFINFLTSILCLILCMFMYLFEIALLLIYSVQGIISYNTINRLIQNFEVKELISQIDSSGTVIKEIYSTAADIGIKEATIDHLLDSYEIKEEAAQYVAGALEYITTKKNTNNISNDKLKQYANIELKEIISEIDPNVSQNEMEKIVKKTNKLLDNLVEKFPSFSSVDETIDENTLYYIRLCFSTSTKKMLFIFIGSIIGLIMLLKFSTYKWLSWFGITTIFSSLIGLLLSVIPMLNFSSLIPGMPNFINNLINSSSNIISSNFTMPSIILFVSGTISIVLYIIIKNIKFKKMNSQEKLNEI